MKSRKLMAVMISLVMLVNILFSTGLTVYADVGIVMDPIVKNFDEVSARALVSKLFADPNMMNHVSNIEIKYNHSTNMQISSFTGGTNGNILEFDEGIAMSTGDLSKNLENNQNYPVSYSKSLGGPLIDKIGSYRVYDPCIISFDFEAPAEGHLVMDYAFASNEYLQYSLSKYNDKFGIIVNGINYAVVPNTNPKQYIAINTINQKYNTEFFRFNTGPNSLKLPIALRGLTSTFSSDAKLIAGKNKVKIIIGDAYDAALDSVLFIRSKSMAFTEEDVDVGTLSISKTGNTLTIVRKREDGSLAVYGPASFSLEEESLDGIKTSKVHVIKAGVSELSIDISQSEDEDNPEKIAFDTKTVKIKDATMGATIDKTKDTVYIKIPAPILTKVGTNKCSIQITGLAGASVDLMKNDAPWKTVVLDGNGQHTEHNVEVAKYSATQTLNDVSSDSSNVVFVRKPPVITGDFSEDTILMNTKTEKEPYLLDEFNVEARNYGGTMIPTQIDNPLDTDTNIPGVYTISWTATADGFTISKTKVVKVKPTKPELFKKNYKDSEISIIGLPNAVVEVMVDGVLYETVTLNDSGEGLILDPPNGDYTAVQIVNTVESDAMDSNLTINRTHNAPMINLKDYTSNTRYKEYEIGKEYALVYTLGESYTELGATANDVEDDNNPSFMSSGNANQGHNKEITKNIIITNPMDHNTYHLDKNGNPMESNRIKPEVGKYIIKYTATDSDKMVGSTNRLVVFKPTKPRHTPVAAEDNTNSRIEVIDAISSASVFLYDENGKAINIVDGAIKHIPENVNHLYQDGKHAKIKIGDVDTQGNFTGIPNGKYRVLQRLYGLNSELSDVITVERSNNSPVVLLKGLPTEIIVVGDPYEDKGVKVSDAEDDHDGYTTALTVDNNVKNTEVGRYTVTYTATDKDNNQTIVGREVIVKPNKPEIIIGDKVRGQDFSSNPKGNDIKVVGVPNSVVQIVKGKKKQGALYKELTLNADGVAYLENLEKTRNCDNEEDEEYEFAAFQTIKNIQSNKAYFEIEKSNTAPSLTIDVEDKIVSIEKNGSFTFRASDALASDVEDSDIDSKILIYKELDDAGSVSGAGEDSIEVSGAETSSVGEKTYYYHVVDSDGNSALRVRQLHILPTAPTMTADDTEITVSGLEAGVTAELFFVESDGSRRLVATKVLPDGDDSIAFSNLETGKYVATQHLNILKSKESDIIGFANPAYLSTKVVDSSDNPIPFLDYTITDEGEVKMEKSDKTGRVLFGVESAKNSYDISFVVNGIEYVVKSVSNEDMTDLHTNTTVVGTLTTKDGKPILLDGDRVVARLYKKNNATYTETKKAKIYYHNGEYILTKLDANTEYLIDVKVRDDENTKVSIARFPVVSGGEKTVKVINKEIKYGEVTDEKGNPLSGVRVTVYPPERKNTEAINNVVDKPDYEKGALTLPVITGIRGSNQNSYVTTDDGKYGYSVYDEVKYVLVATKKGYMDKVVVLDNVVGSILGEDIVMEKDPNYDNYNNIQPIDLPNNVFAADEVSDEVQNVDSRGSISYQSINRDRDDEVITPPKKGRVLMNPESGSIIYLPHDGESGLDEFVLKTRNIYGSSIKRTKKIFIEDKEIQTEPALHLEINASTKKGFVGQGFEFIVDVKNHMNRKSSSSEVAIKIPDGFKVPENSKYRVVNGHIILDLDSIKEGANKKLAFTLMATKPNQNSSINGLIQETSSKKISPLGVSGDSVDVYEVGKKYYVKPYIKGFPNGNFDRNREVTRAELATMLVRCLNNSNEEERSSKTANFSDVKTDDWYNDYVAKAIKFGLFRGYKDGTFRPNNKVTRAELAKVISNYYVSGLVQKGKAFDSFSDVFEHWAEREIYDLKRRGISSGYADGSFKPEKSVTREEVVIMINRMLYRDELPDVDSSFEDMHSKQASFGHIESAYRGYEFEMSEDGEYSSKPMK